MCGIFFQLHKLIPIQKVDSFSSISNDEFYFHPFCALCREKWGLVDSQEWYRSECSSRLGESSDFSPQASLDLRSHPTSKSHLSQTLWNLKRRGPDSFETMTRSYGPSYHTGKNCKRSSQDTPINEKNLSRIFTAASVLGLRGSGSVVSQPFEPVSGNICDSFLLWNGEVFDGPLCPVSNASDTASVAKMFHQLEEEIARDHGETNSLDAQQGLFMSRVVSVIQEGVKGPYAFVYFSSHLGFIVFGRDPLGRRSLLMHLSSPLTDSDEDKSNAVDEAYIQTSFVLSSVGTWRGVVLTDNPEDDLIVHSLERTERKDNTCSADAGFKRRREPPDVEENDTIDTSNMNSCWSEVPISGLFGMPIDPVVEGSTRHRDQDCCHSSRAAVCSSLTLSLRLRHTAWQGSIYQLVHPILKPFHPDFFSAFAQSKEGFSDMVCFSKMLKDLPPKLYRRVADYLVHAQSPLSSMMNSEFTSLCTVTKPFAKEVYDQFSAIRYLISLTKAVERRICSETNGDLGRNDLSRPIGILFSGGIDCSVLAAIAHYVLPLETPIELINVAFGDKPEFHAPDRVAALKSMEELLSLSSESLFLPQENDQACIEREWRFVFVDVPDPSRTDAADFSKSAGSKMSSALHILDLIFPRNTVMDLDIGTALWHAAQGKGRMQKLTAVDGKRNCACAEQNVDSGSESSLNRIVSDLQKYNKFFRLAPSSSVVPKKDFDVTEESPSVSEMNSNAKKERGQNSFPDSEEVFSDLVDVLVAECHANGSNPDTSVLLSTLGKEYNTFLKPCLSRYGYKKLGPYLNDAERKGVVVFDDTAPSKAVKLNRDSDRIRVASTVPFISKWFITNQMLSQRNKIAPSSFLKSELEKILPSKESLSHQYVAMSKVLLLGMGADEVLGGYTRYRRLFKRSGMQKGVCLELNRDFSRLWQRNLGRDDRIVSDSGREARFPFLDEDVLACVSSIVAERKHDLESQYLLSHTTSPSRNPEPLPEEEMENLIQESIDPVLSFHSGPGEGDKKILRTVASILGFDTVTRLEKRAIQFGSRIAIRKIKGTEKLE